MRELIDRVRGWASDRKITQRSTSVAQLMKTVSELGELADATLKFDRDEVIDGIGDVLVTLIIYADMQGLDIEHCLKSAYEEIKDRKGHLTTDGIFVKEES